jgi:hypothetical protein
VLCLRATSAYSLYVSYGGLPRLSASIHNLKHARYVTLTSAPKHELPHTQALQFASKALRANTEFVTLACSQNGLALRWASSTLRNDRSMVLAAVSVDGKALRWASKAMRGKRGMFS